MRLKPFIVMAAAALALVGCGSDTDAPATPGVPTGGETVSLPDPCGIVTQDQASQAMGEQVQAGVPTQTSDGVVCVFSALLGSVAVSVFPGDQFDTLYTANKAAFGESFGDIPDLGEKAFTTPTDVWVLDDGVIIRFAIIGPVTDPGPRALSLAQAALA